MRVCAQIDVSATPEQVWEFITDPERYLHFMHGVTRWEVDGSQRTGLGARYRMLMRVGSAEVGGRVEVTEFDAPRDMAWNSVTGIDQRGRWRVRERIQSHPPRTHVELRLSYGVAGAGLLGWLSERVAAPTVTDNLRRSLQQLKRAVEHEQLRRAAAERRSARASASA
jgi:carbon monoxide dehydrogenase subunit G